jgi:hypothetical protein
MGTEPKKTVNRSRKQRGIAFDEEVYNKMCVLAWREAESVTEAIDKACKAAIAKSEKKDGIITPEEIKKVTKK